METIPPIPESHMRHAPESGPPVPVSGSAEAPSRGLWRSVSRQLPLALILAFPTVLSAVSRWLFEWLPTPLAARFAGPPELEKALLLGLYVPGCLLLSLLGKRPPRDERREGRQPAVVTDVSAGPHAPLRAPAAEARLRAAGWRPLAVIRHGGDPTLDSLSWVSPGNDAFAEGTVLPSGEHLSLTSYRPDGRCVVTAWSEPVLDRLQLRHRDRATFSRDEDLFARHAERVGTGPVALHDRGLLLGSVRALVQRVHKLERRKTMLQVAFGLGGLLLLGIFVTLGAFHPAIVTSWGWSGFLASIMGMIVWNAAIAAMFYIIGRPESSRWLDWEPPISADALRATDASDAALGPLEPERIASQSPFPGVGSIQTMERFQRQTLRFVLVGSVISLGLLLILSLLVGVLGGGWEMRMR